MYSFKADSKDQVFLHQPPMKIDIELEADQLQFEKLTDLLERFYKEKNIITDLGDKSLYVDIINEDVRVSKQKEMIDNKYKQIISDFGEIPDEAKLTNQNNELEYFEKNIKESQKFKESGNLLKKKESETIKLIDLWVEICKNTDQLGKYTNIFNLNEIKEKNNEDLMNYFNDIANQITNETNDH